MDDLRKLYKGRVPGGADLVTYWFEKARAEIESGAVSRAGLISTNGVRFGANRRVLERVKQSGNIFMARPDRPWVQDGAAVRVSMVGFDDGSWKDRTLDGLPVEEIFSDLTSRLDVTRAVELEENAGVCFLGMMKSGPFDLTHERARVMPQEAARDLVMLLKRSLTGHAKVAPHSKQAFNRTSKSLRNARFTLL